MCIYLLQCDCGLCYVGPTRQELKIRIIEHRSRIRNAVLDAPIVQHFVEKQHDSESFTFIVLEIIVQAEDKGGDIHKRLVQQKMFWIFKLCTMHPSGLNENCRGVRHNLIDHAHSSMLKSSARIKS